MSWYSEALAGWYQSKIQSANAMEQGINQFGSAIGKAIGQVAQNNNANQIGSQMANSGAYAPRAALVSPGTNPATGDPNTIASYVPTAGTAPAQFTGGQQKLQMQLQAQNLQRQNANLQSEENLRNAQSGWYNTHSQTAQQQVGINQQRANTYQNSQQNKANPGITIDQVTKQTKDLLGEQAPQWTKQLAGNLPYVKGTYDSKADMFTPDPNGSYYSFGSTPDELSTNAAPSDLIDRIAPLYKQMQGTKTPTGPGTGGAGGASQNGQALPVLTPGQFQQMKANGTLPNRFRGSDGVIYNMTPNGG